MRGTLAYLAAQEHVNDLMREAERARSHEGVRPRSRIAVALSRIARRRTPETYRPAPAKTARARA